MSNEKEPPKLIVVAGPTGSGKTSYIIDRLVRTGKAKDAVFAEYNTLDDLPRIQNLLLRSAPNTLIFVELATNKLKLTSLDQNYPLPLYKTRGNPLMHLASEVIEVEKISEGNHRATFLKSLERPLEIVEFTTEAYFNVYKYMWIGSFSAALSTEAWVKILVRLGY